MSTYRTETAFILLISCGFLLGLALSGGGQGSGRVDRSAADPQKAGLLGEPPPDRADLPLHFIPNKGQVDGKALYYAQVFGGILWTTGQGLILDYRNPETVVEPSPDRTGDVKSESAFLSGCEKTSAFPRYKRELLGLTFQNASTNVRVLPMDPLRCKVSYFIGKDRSRWQSGIPTSQTVVYRGLYSRIDMTLKGTEKMLELSFQVNPGGHAENILLVPEGFQDAEIDHQGNLLIKLRHGLLVTLTKPHGLLRSEETTVTKDIAFSEVDDSAFGFSIDEADKPRLRALKLKIIPIGFDNGEISCDRGYGIHVDPTGFVYITGRTQSDHFPVLPDDDGFPSGADNIFITKISPSGNEMVYSTFLGGSGFDYARSLVADASGAVVITGITKSDDFPNLKAYQPRLAGRTDVFVAKINPPGDRLEYSTYLGGSSDESGCKIVVAPSGSVIIAGWTNSMNFPLKNALDETLSGPRDAFVFQLDSTGSSLLYSTYLGGSGLDFAKSLTIDSAGSVWVTGYTTSTDFPLHNPCQAELAGKTDAFISLINEMGDLLLFSSYLGGSGRDIGNDIVLDTVNSIYITGYTDSSDFPTRNAFSGILSGGADAFIAKFSPPSCEPVYATYLGGSLDESGCALGVDASGAAYVTGYTYSRDFPVRNALASDLSGKRDAYVLKLGPGGNEIGYCTFLGGSGEDCGRAIDVDTSGAVYVTGCTSSMDFPLRAVPRASAAGAVNAFVTKIGPGGKRLVYSTSMGVGPGE